MAAPTLFRRLVVTQAIAAAAVVLVVGALFYVERNRTVAKLAAQRWAPALREAAHLPDVPASSAGTVLVRDLSPGNAMGTNAWAPRISMLRQTLRDEGVPVTDVRFAPGRNRPITWLEIRTPDGRVRWLGIDEEVVASHVVGRIAIALVGGLLVVGLFSALAARRLARPLEALRRRIESHAAPGGGRAAPREASAAPGAAPSAATPMPTSTPTSTQEIDAIASAWATLSERLERQESERALLLAGVSHDLRSPLARIRMAAELLPEGDGIAARRESIVRNVDVADRLVASFLEYVRAAELPLDDTVDVAAVAARVIELRAEPAARLALEAPARLDLPRANALLIERLIGNLVDNAMRHGRPPVRVHLHRDGGEVIVDVEDHGDGIPPADRARMTRAFARGDASRGTPGTGLGLAVVAQVAQRMGGRLSFEIAAGGHRARVRLPGGA
jgi:two-component system osmolarity sensor histidine kinase EnvZ